MHLIEVVARRSKRMLGLADDSQLVCAIRPVYNTLLQQLYGRSGLVRIIDGQESVRLRPRDRLIPEDYEPAVFNFLKNTVQEGAVILDVGAHVGVLTMLMARWAGQNGRVYAFEPNPICREALLDHLELNNLTGRVNVSSLALSDQVGTNDFYSVGTSGISSFSNACVDDTAERIEVSTTTIDSFCSSGNVTPSLIKIDVEGFEFSVLKGARNILRQFRPTVLIEFHPMNWSALGIRREWAQAQLAELEYTVTKLDGQRDIYSDYGHVVLEPRTLS